MFGPYFVELATKNKVIYSTCNGDQHAVLKRMIDEIKMWGFQIVMAGNMKGFLDRTATVSTLRLEAQKRGLDCKQCACFTDGTKLNIEMALIANAEGYVTKKRGMFGPRVGHVRDVLSHFNLKKLWMDRTPFVDYILGAEPNGGVYVVGYHNDPYHREVLHQTYKMGAGPFYVFYRPYHLCYFEAAGTIVDAVVNKRAQMQPRPVLTTNVFAFAKKNLCKGEELDGAGGNTCYGLIENMADQAGAEGLPVCLASGVRIKKAVRKNAKILLENVECDPSRPDYATYYNMLNGIPAG
jgi:predicted homoserine dehydrogenase-like protein